MITIGDISRVCYEVNRAYRLALGEEPGPAWDEAPQEIRNSLVLGISYRLRNPSCSPEQQHEAWLESKRNVGWSFGPEKNEAKKTHPCRVA